MRELKFLLKYETEKEGLTDEQICDLFVSEIAKQLSISIIKFTDPKIYNNNTHIRLSLREVRYVKE